MTGSKTEQSETLLMEELSKKISDVTQELDQLKNWLDDLSMEEKNTRLIGIESLIFDCSENLEDLESDTTTFRNKGELQELRVKVDTLIWQKEELRNQIGSQIQSIDESNQSVTENQNDGQQTEEWQWKKWLRKWWSSLTDKEKKSVRTVWWLAWLWILWLWIFRWRRYDYEKEIPWYSEMSRKKKRGARRELRQKKRKERRENRPWWQKFLIWWAIAGWTVVWWVQVYKHWNQIKSWVKEKLWLALSFDEAKQKVEDEVRNGKIDNDHFGVFNSNFENWITFDEQTQEICSYDQKTKIDKKNKKLEWLDVSFASYEELIHAANIVNFAKRKLRWRWATARPFWQTERWWDIAFNCSANWKQEFLSANNSNERSWILGTIWVAWWWILWWYCAWVKWAAIWWLAWWAWWYALWAYIDNTSAAWRCCSTIARWRNFDLFILYLNDQKDENGKSLWESAWEQHIDPNWTPINGLVDNWAENMGEWEWILAEIEKEYWEDQTWRRKLDIIWDESNPTEYTIESFGHRTKLIIEWWPTKKWDTIDYSKITKIHIEKYNESDWWDWLDIDFPKTKEWLEEAIRTVNLTNMFREDWSGKWREDYSFSCWRFIGLDWKSLYFDAWEFYWKWTRLLDRKTLKEKYPTIFKDITKEGIILSNHQEEYHNQAINDESTWSQYIKFLHQMWEWRYWKKIN